MKLLFITTGLGTGGAEMMLLKLLSNLDRSRFNPVVISLSGLGEVGPKIQSIGIRVLPLNINCFNFPLKAIVLAWHLISIKPQIVQTWMYHADFFGGIVARLCGSRRVIWGVRNSDLSALSTKRSTLILVKLCSFLSKIVPYQIVTCSSRAAIVHGRLGYSRNKFHVIPNGFELDRFIPSKVARLSVREELVLPRHVKLVGLIARFDPQKNHFGFIEAASIVKSNIQDVHFVLAGKDVDNNNNELIALIKKFNMLGCVHLLGRRDDVPRLMSSFDLLVSSSSYGEAFPNVLGEAMACAVPCVVTDVGDSSSIVGDAGRVVKPNDMNELANEIINVLRLSLDDKSSLDNLARMRVESEYEIGHVVDLYQDYYLSLVNLNKA